MAGLLLLLFAINGDGAQSQVRDLTQATAETAQWRIVETRSGGPVGTWPKPPAHEPVRLHLFDLSRRGNILYFSLEVMNDREEELEVPVSLSSKQHDRPGSIIHLRELLVSLGTSEGDTPGSFSIAHSIAPVSLYGSSSVPETIHRLLPGEKLTLRLKTEIGVAPTLELRSLRARITAWDIQLAPQPEGYKETRTSIPALLTISEYCD
jgi:hypothetical protein